MLNMPFFTYVLIIVTYPSLCDINISFQEKYMKERPHVFRFLRFRKVQNEWNPAKLSWLKLSLECCKGTLSLTVLLRLHYVASEAFLKYLLNTLSLWTLLCGVVNEDIEGLGRTEQFYFLPFCQQISYDFSIRI